jgi:hypothetical protein
MADRYLKVILTLIAVELAWIGVSQSARPLSAQAGMTPVVIRGIEIGDQRAYLPVGIVGAYQRVPDTLTRTLNPVVANIDTSRPLPIQMPVTVRTIDTVRIQEPVQVESPNGRPLKVESVPYTPGQKPGE